MSKIAGLKVGVDLVNIKRFKKTLQEGEVGFERRVFNPTEWSQSQRRGLVRLAGIFAAKEAVIKALNLPAESWLAIEVLHSQTGRPAVYFLEKKIREKLASFDLSISHTQKYVLAFFVAVLKDE